MRLWRCQRTHRYGKIAGDIDLIAIRVKCDGPGFVISMARTIVAVCSIVVPELEYAMVA